MNHKNRGFCNNHIIRLTREDQLDQVKELIGVVERLKTWLK